MSTISDYEAKYLVSRVTDPNLLYNRVEYDKAWADLHNAWKDTNNRAKIEKEVLKQLKNSKFGNNRLRTKYLLILDVIETFVLNGQKFKDALKDKLKDPLLNKNPILKRKTEEVLKRL
ncbi:hypothetical protein J7K86_01015 [bacterium]|nr:hypothetical protein [bacterium]